MKTLRLLLAAQFAVLCSIPMFAQDAAVEKGKKVYTYWCATCHGSGRGFPGTAALAAKYRGTDRPALLEERTDLTPQSIRLYVRNGVSVMPMFRKTEVSDADLEAIVAYLTRNRPATSGAK